MADANVRFTHSLQTKFRVKEGKGVLYVTEYKYNINFLAYVVCTRVHKTADSINYVFRLRGNPMITAILLLCI